MKNKFHFSASGVLLTLVFVYGWATILAVSWLALKNTIIPGFFSPMPFYPANIYIYAATNLLTDAAGLFLLFYLSRRFTTADVAEKTKIIGWTALFGCLLAIVSVPHYRLPEEMNRPAAFWSNTDESTLPGWKDTARCRQYWREKIAIGAKSNF